MYCSNCGAFVPEQAKFCPECGGGVQQLPQNADSGATEAADTQQAAQAGGYGAPQQPSGYGAPAANAQPAVPASGYGASTYGGAQPAPKSSYNAASAYGAAVAGGNKEQPKEGKGKKKPIGLIVAAAAVLLAAAVLIPVFMRASKNKKMEEAAFLYEAGDYAAAQEKYLELGTFENAGEQAEACQLAMDYEAAVAIMDSGDHAAAIGAFNALGSYEDSMELKTECQNQLDYAAAIAAFEAKDYGTALPAFKLLGTYQDAQEHVKECENAIAYEEAAALKQAGDYTQAAAQFLALADASYLDSLEMGKECLYKDAEAAYEQGAFYQAYKKFSDSELAEYSDSAARAAACVQEHPKTGILFQHEDYKKSQCTIKFEPSKDGNVTLIKIYTPENLLIGVLFIREGATAQIKVPAGKYIVKTAYGKQWFGEEDMFGDDGTYRTLLEYGEAVQQFDKNFIYTFTLRTTGGNLGGQSENPNSF